jgi:hypothetical protein
MPPEVGYDRIALAFIVLQVIREIIGAERNWATEVSTDKQLATAQITLVFV